MADYSYAYDRYDPPRNPTTTELEKRIKELEAQVEALTPKARYKVWTHVDATSAEDAIRRAKDANEWITSEVGNG